MKPQLAVERNHRRADPKTEPQLLSAWTKIWWRLVSEIGGPMLTDRQTDKQTHPLQLFQCDTFLLTLERPYGSFLTHEFGAAVNRCTRCLAVSDCFFCAPGIPHLLHCINLNIISHVAALSAIGIGRVLCSFCRLVCLSVCWKRVCILEEWLRQLKCHLG